MLPLTAPNHGCLQPVMKYFQDLSVFGTAMSTATMIPEEKLSISSKAVNLHIRNINIITGYPRHASIFGIRFPKRNLSQQQPCFHSHPKLYISFQVKQISLGSPDGDHKLLKVMSTFVFRIRVCQVRLLMQGLKHIFLVCGSPVLCFLTCALSLSCHCFLRKF